MAQPDSDRPGAEAQRRFHEALSRVARDRGGDMPGPSTPYRVVFDNTLEVVMLLAPDGTVLDANRAALDVARAGRDALLGLPLWEHPCWRHDDATRRQLRASVNAASQGLVVHHELRFTSAGGNAVVSDFSVRPLVDEAERAVLLIAEARDVTASRLVEDALRASEQRLERIVSLAGDAIITLDDERRVVLFNESAGRIFGYDPHEVVGRPLDDLLPEGLAPAHDGFIAAFAASGVASRRMGERRQIFGRRRSGEIFPAEASISQLDAGGRRFFTVVLRDVTERWLADQEKSALLRDAELARAEAESASRRVELVFAASGALAESLDVEETLRRLPTIVVPELATMCVLDLLAPGGELHRLHVLHADPGRQLDAERLASFVRDISTPSFARETLLTGRSSLVTHATGEELQRVTSGDEHLALLRDLDPRSFLSVPMVARGRVLGAITMVRCGDGAPAYAPDDLALAEVLASHAALAVDNARLYHDAQRTTRLRDEVLGVVSHDLRTPLSVIAMCASALNDGPPSAPERVRELSSIIHESTGWMQRLVSDLLDIASIEAGKLSMELEPTDVSAILARAREMFAHAAADGSLRLEVEVSEPLPRAHADGERVLQVLANLVGNAIKFTPPGGRVRIRARDAGDALELAVEDSGAGIPEADVPHLFDRFWHAGRPGAVRGTGLGLAIAKGIVDAHGGRIRVETARGAGTTFTFTIPVARQPAAPRPAMPRGAAPALNPRAPPRPADEPAAGA